MVFRVLQTRTTMGLGADTSLSFSFLISKMKSHFSKSYGRILIWNSQHWDRCLANTQRHPPGLPNITTPPTVYFHSQTIIKRSWITLFFCLKLPNVSLTHSKFLGNTQPHILPSFPPPLLLPSPIFPFYCLLSLSPPAADPFNHLQAHKAHFRLRPFALAAPSIGKVFFRN